MTSSSTNVSLNSIPKECLSVILKTIEELESKHNITILYAVESGSRAWGFESVDSDYDVRFIFKHNDVKSYLNLNPPVESINTFSEDRLYDWDGWDIRKALKDLRNKGHFNFQ